MPATPPPGVGDPCFCGSGRPFGVCCRAEYDSATSVWRGRREAEIRLVRAIIDYGYARNGPRLLLHGWDLFMRSEIVPGDRDRHREQFDYWFAFVHVANVKDATIDFGYPADWPYRPLAVEWLEADGRAASDADRALVSRLLASPWTLLGIERVTPGWSMLVRDLLTGRRKRVVDPDISRLARLDDVFVSAVVTADGVSTFVGPATCAMPPAWRIEAAALRRDTGAARDWLTRAQVAGEADEVFGIYHNACIRKDGPYPYLQRDGLPLEPWHFRWRLTVPFFDAVERLRSLTAAFDDHAIELEPGAEGEPRANLVWYRQNDPDDFDDCSALAYLFLDEGLLSADVPTRARGEDLLAEIESRLGPDAILLEARACPGLTPLRDDERGMVVSGWW